MNTVVETAEFQKQAKTIWSDAEREAFIDWIAANPDAGDVSWRGRGTQSALGPCGKRQARRREGDLFPPYRRRDCVAGDGLCQGCASQRKAQGHQAGLKMKALKKMDVNKIARAIETDAGHALPGLRESLAQAKAGDFLRVHTPEQIAARRRGRPAGSKQEVTKEAVKLRLDADVMAALRASGDGWQTRINEALRASLALSGKIGKQ
jgi:uncharacterized protein (DUF4415 family)